MAFKQIGVTALRSPTGEFLPSQPIYIEIPEKELNPKTNMLPQEEKTLSNVASIFAEKFGQYVDECKAAGLEANI